MRRFYALSTVFLLILSLHSLAWGHRVNIFAWIEGGSIIAECGFNKSSKVKNGLIEIRDAANDTLLATARTDDNGRCSVPIPDGATEHGIIVRVIAGEGHQNDWTISADEISAAVHSPQSAIKDAPSTKQDSAMQASAEKTAVREDAVTRAELEEVINKALDARFNSINRLLSDVYSSGPSMRDIIGGIGWIFGLFGVAALVHSRRKP